MFCIARLWPPVFRYCLCRLSRPLCDLPRPYSDALVAHVTRLARFGEEIARLRCTDTVRCEVQATLHTGFKEWKDEGAWWREAHFWDSYKDSPQRQGRAKRAEEEAAAGK